MSKPFSEKNKYSTRILKVSFRERACSKSKTKPYYLIHEGKKYVLDKQSSYFMNNKKVFSKYGFSLNEFNFMKSFIVYLDLDSLNGNVVKVKAIDVLYNYIDEYDMPILKNRLINNKGQVKILNAYRRNN